MIYIIAIETALILLILFVSLSFTIPKLERLWFKYETFIIIFAPAVAFIGVMIWIYYCSFNTG